MTPHQLLIPIWWINRNQCGSSWRLEIKSAPHNGRIPTIKSI